MGRRKRKNIYIKDPDVQKKIEDLRKLFPDLTYDQIFKTYLNVPTPDQILGDRYFEIVDLLKKRHKNEKIDSLGSYLWVLLLNSSNGQFDIDRVLYDVQKSVDNKIYHKRKSHSSNQ